MNLSLFAFELTAVEIGTVIVVLLMGLWLVPYLVRENTDGKKERGPLIRHGLGGRVSAGPITTPGTGDTHPGTIGNPAPGQPDAQADPYGPQAQRRGSPVQS
ncbi:MAG: hypothetical protein ABJA98_21540 [Acidobacteriota bacterium]